MFGIYSETKKAQESYLLLILFLEALACAHLNRTSNAESHACMIYTTTTDATRADCNSSCHTAGRPSLTHP